MFVADISVVHISRRRHFDCISSLFIAKPRSRRLMRSTCNEMTVGRSVSLLGFKWFCHTSSLNSTQLTHTHIKQAECPPRRCAWEKEQSVRSHDSNRIEWEAQKRYIKCVRLQTDNGRKPKYIGRCVCVIWYNCSNRPTISSDTRNSAISGTLSDD